MTLEERSPALSSSPYVNVLDINKLAQLEKGCPGSAKIVLELIRADIDWRASQIEKRENQDHTARMWSIALTVFTVLGIAGMATLVIMTGHEVAGSVLAALDLVALASVMVNSWRRVVETQ